MQAISAIFSQAIFRTEFPALPRGAVVSAHLRELHTAKDGWSGTVLLGRTGLGRETVTPRRQKSREMSQQLQ